MGNTIHIGSIIKKKVEESNMSIAEFAEKIYCDRTTVYDLFKRKSIDIEKLIRISEVLEYNFIEKVYLAQESHQTTHPSTVPHSETENTIVYIAIPVHWKDLSKINLPEGYLILQKYPKEQT